MEKVTGKGTSKTQQRKVMEKTIEKISISSVNRKAHYSIVVAVTIDGFIARYPGHKSDWTSKEDKEHLHEMEEKADAFLFARKTYEMYKEIVKSKFKDKKSIVLTSTVDRVEEKDGAIYLNPEKTNLLNYVEENGFMEICNLGGRGSYDFALQNNLIDDIYLTIEPIVFGSGIGMFSKESKTKDFLLVSSKKLNEKGSLLLHYKKVIE